MVPCRLAVGPAGGAVTPAYPVVDPASPVAGSAFPESAAGEPERITLGAATGSTTRSAVALTFALMFNEKLSAEYFNTIGKEHFPEFIGVRIMEVAEGRMVAEIIY